MFKQYFSAQSRLKKGLKIIGLICFLTSALFLLNISLAGAQSCDDLCPFAVGTEHKVYCSAENQDDYATFYPGEKRGFCAPEPADILLEEEIILECPAPDKDIGQTQYWKVTSRHADEGLCSFPGHLCHCAELTLGARRKIDGPDEPPLTDPCPEIDCYSAVRDEGGECQYQEGSEGQACSGGTCQRRIDGNLWCIPAEDLSCQTEGERICIQPGLGLNKDGVNAKVYRCTEGEWQVIKHCGVPDCQGSDCAPSGPVGPVPEPPGPPSLCDECGDGIFNVCNKTACEDLGDCYFIDGFWFNRCLDKIEASFTLEDARSGQPIAGALVKTVKRDKFSSLFGSCLSGGDGSCQIGLPVDTEMAVYVKHSDYSCPANLCAKHIQPTLDYHNYDLKLNPLGWYTDDCYDSDYGLRPDVAGKITFNNGLLSGKDTCKSPNELEERYCSAWGPGRTTYNCQHGCLNGACQSEVFTDDCADCRSGGACTKERCAYLGSCVFEPISINDGLCKPMPAPPPPTTEKTNVDFKVVYQTNTGTARVPNIDLKVFDSSGGLAAGCQEESGLCSITLPAEIDYTIAVSAPGFVCAGCPKAFKPSGANMTIEVLMERDFYACQYNACPAAELQEIKFRTFYEDAAGAIQPVTNSLVEVFFEDTLQKAGFCSGGAASSICFINLCPFCRYSVKGIAKDYIDYGTRRLFDTWQTPSIVNIKLTPLTGETKVSCPSGYSCSLIERARAECGSGLQSFHLGSDESCTTKCDTQCKDLKGDNLAFYQCYDPCIDNCHSAERSEYCLDAGGHPQYHCGLCSAPPPPPPQKCDDGTAYDSCSVINPLEFCQNGNLVVDCLNCPTCPAGQVCNSQTRQCEAVPPAGCPGQGLAEGECWSANLPWRCLNSALVQDCINCQCPAGEQCQADGSCKIIVVPPTKCSDGTPFNSCSLTKPPPLYCDNNGNFVNKCSACPCPAGQQCQADGTCKPLLPLTCWDGTALDRCSVTQPLYCFPDGTLLNQCSVCRCPVDRPTCQPDGSCIAQGQIEEIQTPSGTKAKMEVTEGAVDEPVDLSITFAPVTSDDSYPKVPAAPACRNIVSDFVFDYRVKSVPRDQELDTFGGEGIIITVIYTDDEVAGYDESSLTICILRDGRWEALPTYVNIAMNEAIAKTYHFSPIAFSINTLGVPGTGTGRIGLVGDPCCGKEHCSPGLVCAAGCLVENCSLEEVSGELITKGNYSICIPPDAEAVCPTTTYSSILELINGLLKWIFWFVIILAPLLILIGAFMFMTSAGEPRRVHQARQIIIWSAIGLGVVAFSRAIYSIIMGILQ